MTGDATSAAPPSAGSHAPFSKREFAFFRGVSRGDRLSRCGAKARSLPFDPLAPTNVGGRRRRAVFTSFHPLARRRDRCCIARLASTPQALAEAEREVFLPANH